MSWVVALICQPMTRSVGMGLAGSSRPDGRGHSVAPFQPKGKFGPLPDKRRPFNPKRLSPDRTDPWALGLWVFTLEASTGEVLGSYVFSKAAFNASLAGCGLSVTVSPVILQSGPEFQAFQRNVQSALVSGHSKPHMLTGSPGSGSLFRPERMR